MRRTLAISILACLAACGEAPATPPKVVFDTVGGVIHVRNSPVGQWGDRDAWVTRRTARIGAVEAPEEALFTNRVMTPSLGPDGYVYVLEYSNPRVAIFDREGEFVEQLGRRGRGPGEFLAPTGLTWDAYGRLWVADAWGPRYSVYDSDRTFLGTRERPVTVVRRQQHQMTTLADGSIVDESSDTPMLYFLAVDSASGMVDTIASVRRPEPPRELDSVFPGRESVLSEVLGNYMPSVEWAMSSNGTYWVGSTATLELLHLASPSDTLRIVRSSHRNADLDPGERDLILEAEREAGLDAGGLGAVKNLFAGLHMLDSGHLLVELVEAGASERSQFDVFDPEGRYLGVLELSFRVASGSVLTSRGDTIVGVEVDSMDVPFVVIDVIERPR